MAIQLGSLFQNLGRQGVGSDLGTNNFGNLLMGLTNPGMLLGAIAMRQLARRRAQNQLGDTTAQATLNPVNEVPVVRPLEETMGLPDGAGPAGVTAHLRNQGKDVLLPPVDPFATEIRAGGRARDLRGRAAKRNRAKFL